MKDAKRPLEVSLASALSALDIYDVAPDDATYPFTEFGETIEIDDPDKSNFGSEVVVTFYIRDRFQNTVSRQSVNEIKGTILETLRVRPDSYPSVTGFKIISITIEDSNSQKLTDDSYIYITEILRLRIRLYEL